MKHPREFSAGQLVAYALLSLLVSWGAFYSWATFTGIPPRPSLRLASGQVSWTQEYRYGMRFGLASEPRQFVYISKSNAMGLVISTLTSPDKPTVSVLYDPNRSGGPVGSKDRYFETYELSANGRTVRSWRQVQDAWRSDEQVALYLSGVFLLSSIFLGFSALRTAGAT